MPIVRNYGNITDAMSLGQQAGAGDAFRWRFNAEQQGQAGLRQQEQIDDASKANQISQALDMAHMGYQQANYQQTSNEGAKEFGVTSGLHQQDLVLRQQQEANQTAYQNRQLAIQKANSDISNRREQSQADLNDAQAGYYQQQGTYRDAATEALQNKTGNYGPGNPEFDSALKTIGVFQEQLKIAQQQAKAADPYGLGDRNKSPNYRDAIDRVNSLSQNVSGMLAQHQARASGQQPQQVQMPAPQPFRPMSQPPAGGGFNPQQAGAAAMGSQVPPQGPGGQMAGQGGRVVNPKPMTVKVGGGILPVPAPPPGADFQTVVSIFQSSVVDNIKQQNGGTVPPQLRPALEQQLQQYLSIQR